MGKSNKTGTWLLVALVAAGVGFLGYQNIIRPFLGGERETGGVPCINPALPMPEELHIHPMLKIVINGRESKVPANIGIETFGCERALHTHDDTGELHIEPNFPQIFTLGQFFTLWGKEFSSSTIFEHKTDDAHEIALTVDGEPNAEYGDLVLKDKQQILIEYEGK